MNTENLKENRLNKFNAIFWTIIPIFWINELLFGQRIPKKSWIDKSSNKPLQERTYVKCPHCNTYHDGRTWSLKRAYGNWFGIYCPNCEGIIPSLTNIGTYVILGITYPLWFWYKDNLKQRWLRMQKKRFSGRQIRMLDFSKKLWLIIGLIWGAIMFLTMNLIDGNFENPIKDLITWLVGGLIFGGLMMLFMGYKTKKAQLK
jgi:hypothetical protein